MKNAWEEINLNDYERHMSLDSVRQLQAMNEMMQEQFYAYPVKSLMVLGIAGGNGLEHIDLQGFEKVYGVDINQSYLDECEKRYPRLKEVLHTVHADLTSQSLELPEAELLVANLLIEYIGYENFNRVVILVKPEYVTCIIQINPDTSFVSDSPYLHIFDRLAKVHHQIDGDTLQTSMSRIGYMKKLAREKELPNGKKLLRMDFSR
ncbi:MAG: class I SAM-dependent methyltransferase [Anaerolineae bacterium]